MQLFASAFVTRSGNVFSRRLFRHRFLRSKCSTLSRIPRKSRPTSSTRPLFASALRCASSTGESTTGRPVEIEIGQEAGALEEQDTIFALSSGAGVTAGVAVIRLSGPAAKHCLLSLLKENSRPPKARFASFRRLYDPETKDLLDEAIVLYFPGPKSFTGEDVVELQVHGSRAVINAVFESLEKVEGESVIRPAERGEFTRRAFENGRMDLTRVEGLADLISSETALQRKQALRQLSGEVFEMLESWREEIKTCLAHAEAVIDFGDDVDDETFEMIIPRVRELRNKLYSYLNNGYRGEIVRGGARVAIVGEPNAGKSTLLNALAQRPAAIVSPIAGTTRDVVEVQLDINGLPVIVSDTAGLRDTTDDPVEIEGMHRAKRVAAEADLTILVHDGTTGRLADAIEYLPQRLKRTEQTHHHQEGRFSRDNLICVINKADIASPDLITTSEAGFPVFRTSLIHDEGLPELIAHLETHLRNHVEGSNTGKSGEGNSSGSVPVITRARHRHHMKLAVAALDSFLDGRSGPDPRLYLPMDLATEDLRIAGKELGSITGVIHAEEVLDVIFSEFCIGK